MEKIVDAIMYAVKDLEAEVFDIPFFTKNDLFAKRKFYMDIMMDGNTMVSKFPQHFNLYRLGTYNASLGKMNAEFTLIIKGEDVLKEKQNEISNGAQV